MQSFYRRQQQQQQANGGVAAAVTAIHDDISHLLMAKHLGNPFSSGEKVNLHVYTLTMMREATAYQVRMG